MDPVVLVIIFVTSLALDANTADGETLKDTKGMAKGFYEPDTEKYCNLEVACDGISGARFPIQLPRGRDGRDGLPGPVGPPGLQGEPGPPGETSGDIQHSAFMASLAEHRYAKDFQSDAIILKYDSMVTNVGDDYDLTTGMYTAPLSGTYTFSLTFAAHVGKEAAGELRRSGSDDSYVGRVWVISRPVWTSTSSTFTVHLTKGQTVWVKPIQGALDYYGNSYCTFSGHVLFYD